MMATNPFHINRLLASLKGHGDRVLALDLSPNDKFLASSSQDRSMILWPSKHFASKDHRSSRGNVPYDVCIYKYFKAYAKLRANRTSHFQFLLILDHM